MKPITNLFLVFTLFTISIFWSCEMLETGTTTSENPSANLKSCTNECAFGSNDTLSIPDDCAICRMNKFADNNYTLPKVNGEKPRGFQIQNQELLELLEAIKDDSTAQVFAMFAIGEEVDSTGKTIDVPDMIFLVQGENGSVLPIRESYYDFTAPCPTYCPDISESN